MGHNVLALRFQPFFITSVCNFIHSPNLIIWAIVLGQFNWWKYGNCFEWMMYFETYSLQFFISVYHLLILLTTHPIFLYVYISNVRAMRIQLMNKQMNQGPAYHWCPMNQRNITIIRIPTNHRISIVILFIYFDIPFIYYSYLKIEFINN